MSGDNRSRTGERSQVGGADPPAPSPSDQTPEARPEALRKTPIGMVLPTPVPVDAPVQHSRRRTVAKTTAPKSLVPQDLTGHRRGDVEVPDFMRGGGAEPPAAGRRAEPSPPRAGNQGRAAAFDPAATNAVPRRDQPPPARRASKQTQLPAELLHRDYRKPQLSATLHAPLSDRDRRRASQSEMNAAAEPLPFELDTTTTPYVISTTATGAQVVQELRSEQTLDRVAAGELDLPTAGQHKSIDYRLILAFALALCGAALALPAAVGTDVALWAALLRDAGVPWGMGLGGTVVLTAVALIAFVVAWSREDLLPDTEDDLPASGWLLVAGCSAVGAIVLRGAADPDLVRAATAPMREGLFGLPLVVWGAVAAGGLWQLSDGRRARSARLLTAAGGLGMLTIGWMPIGWLGSASLPFFAAFSADSADTAIAAERVLTPVMAAPSLVLVQCLLGPGVLALLTVPRAPSRIILLGASAAALVLPCLSTLWSAPASAGMAALGATALLLGHATIVAGVTALALDRLVRIGPSDTRNELENLAVFALIAIWLLAKVNGLRASATDESIYFYAAKAWADGTWPYHDFFFSHPPLHILPLAVIYTVTGFSLPAGKLLSVAAILLVGITVWRMTRAYIDPLAGVLALGLFLFAAETLKASTNLTGVNLTTMWVTFAVAAALGKRFFLAGILSGIAACTGVYSAAAVLAVAVLSVFVPHDESQGPSTLFSRVFAAPVVQLIFGFALVFGTINYLFYLMAGDEYVNGVYRYHFLKAAKTDGFRPMSEGLGAMVGNLGRLLVSSDFTITTYYHAAHLWLALLAPAGVALGIAVERSRRTPADGSADSTVALRKRKRRGRGQPQPEDLNTWLLLVDPRRWWRTLEQGGFALIAFFIAWAVLAEFAQFKERYSFYYVLLLPFVSIAAASWIAALLRIGAVAVGGGWRWSRASADELPERGSPPSWIKGAAVAAAVMTTLWVPVNTAANRRAWPSEFSKKDAAGKQIQTVGERLNFEWRDAPGPAFVSQASRGLLWKPYRLRGNIEAGLHHYMWSKKRWFSTAQEIATYINRNSGADDTITGSSTHAPLIALLADRRLAADHVDTNSKVFKTGIVGRREFWEKICADRVRYIVAGPMSFFSPQVMRRKPNVARNFKMIKTFSDRHLNHWRTVTLELWERNDPSGKTPCVFYGTGQ